MPRSLFTVLVFVPGMLAAQESLQVRFDRAYDQWDRGEYPAAIAGLNAILLTPGGDAYLADIALLTGERYQTVEVSGDGTNPTWSPDGEYVVFETPSGGGLRSHVVRITTTGVEPIADVPGTRVHISPDGNRLVSLSLRAGPELARARRTARESINVRTRADFARVQQAIARVDARHTDVLVTSLRGGTPRRLEMGDLAVFDVRWADEGTMYLVAAQGSDSTTHVYRVTGASPERVTAGDAWRSDLRVLAGSRHALLTVDDQFGILDLTTGRTTLYDGSSATASADGSTVAFATRGDGSTMLHVMRVGETPRIVYRTRFPVESHALSPRGDRLVFQVNPREDWELMVVDVATGEATQLTHEIQHDLYPRFLDDTTVFAVMGEGRHRRSYLYDVNTGRRERFFHNNTIRTVAPEYEWVASPDGSKVLIVAERDGDTISPERGVYVVDRTRVLVVDDLLHRLDGQRAEEENLRERGRAAFARVAVEVTAVVAAVSPTRIYGYAAELFSYGSKFITQPGNSRAIAYLADQLRSFGYEPELQGFEPRPGIESANVIATLRGTRHPELRYVVSSHFDSVERGPGADDNSSGTTALLEAARVMAAHPQTATIQFAFFTGEEAGLLGSREFVRRAVAAGHRIVGALNNDMVGYANDNRLDNTIRYSNAGIRDIQHAAAFLFTDLITYDAKYYKSTDAHAYYEAYGDIVGGIGSYPILGNPHYHQTHDVLETINQQLVAEVSKTTVATLVLLAASPARLTDLDAQTLGNGVTVTWAPSGESDVVGYVVEYGPNASALTRVTTQVPSVTVPADSAAFIRVKAVNDRGLESWDWAVNR